jgi:hypothetical protein
MRRTKALFVAALLIGAGVFAVFMLLAFFGKGKDTSAPGGAKVPSGERVADPKDFQGEAVLPTTLEDEIAVESLDPDEPLYFVVDDEGNIGVITAGEYLAETKPLFVRSAQTKGAVSQAPPVPAVSDDSDGDGLTYDQELNAGTDPNNPDTDGDGLSDFAELRAFHTDPKNFDTDKDGLTDGEEVNTRKTNPLIADTDGDGYGDGEEVQAGYNPLGEGRI